MEITLDKYGRIVIPKSVRERLGLKAGARLELEVEQGGEQGEAVRLRPADREPLLKEKNGGLVFGGRLADERYDVVEHLRSARERRARRLAGLPPKKKSS